MDIAFVFHSCTEDVPPSRIIGCSAGKGPGVVDDNQCEQMFWDLRCEFPRGHGPMHRAKRGSASIVWGDAPNLDRRPRVSVAPPEDDVPAD